MDAAVTQLIEWTTQVIIRIQFCGQTEHSAAIVARQCGIDLRNHLGGRSWIVDIRVS
jgi:hypothetical protein